MDARKKDDREELNVGGAFARLCEGRLDFSIRKLRAMALLGLALAFGHGPAAAANLVEFTFGAGTGTDLAQSVAGHLHVTPVVGVDGSGIPAPHSFVDLGGGNMAMRLLRSDGGYRFDFTITADPGYAFQVTDAHFAFRTQDTAGVARNISVWPNADPRVIWYDATGGDAIFTDMGPGGFGWKTANWNTFITRTDLQTLIVQLSLKGNSNAGHAYGTDLSEPEKSALMEYLKTK